MDAVGILQKAFPAQTVVRRNRGGAVAIRKNTLIFIIACILVWAAAWLAKRQRRCLIIILALIISTVAGIIFPQKFYEFRAKNTMGSGVPAMAYIAMGMQWSEGRSPGEWNGYHADLFIDCSYDAEETSRISAEAVKTSLKYMMSNPGYMAEFYYYKLVGQWDREDFMCLYETLEFYGNRTSAAWEIYQGRAKDGLMSLMSVYQSLVYLGAALFCISGMVRWKKGDSDMSSVGTLPLLATFTGGFLFSMIWEASPRYAMPYFVMLIPYAADGLAGISYYLEETFLSRKRRGE